MKKLEIIKREAKRIFASAKGSHDWEHTERVYNMAVHIAKKEGANLEIVRYAAILHDIGRRQEDESGGKICHAAKGAQIAAKILAGHGLSNDKIVKITHCIETHRFRSNKKPRTPEAKAVFDADKLDSIGAVGIGRAFLFAGEIGAKLHNKGVAIEKTRPYTCDDTAYREYRVKLMHVKSRILTREGRRIARERDEFMKEFFARLDSEVKGSI